MGMSIYCYISAWGKEAKNYCQIMGGGSLGKNFFSRETVHGTEKVILGGGGYSLLTVSLLTNWLAHWLLMTDGMVSLPPKPAF